MVLVLQSFQQLIELVKLFLGQGLFFVQAVDHQGHAALVGPLEQVLGLLQGSVLAGEQGGVLLAAADLFRLDVALVFQAAQQGQGRAAGPGGAALEPLPDLPARAGRFLPNALHHLPLGLGEVLAGFLICHVDPSFLSVIVITIYHSCLRMSTVFPSMKGTLPSLAIPLEIRYTKVS